ncbi:helix-turn-helix domain-containing protein [Peribacillus sp. NPDC096379]|uniref:GH39 family glycosyl hydrolase n=1 Tax=Peribacillus sp. NPDC096379 TaxID=3364393 RepID=UPI0038107515
MDYIYEVINTKDLPVHIFLHHVEFVNKHWHDSIELLFVLKGQVTVWVQNNQYNLTEKDIMLINANDIHSLQSMEDNLLIALQIPVSLLEVHIKELEKIVFNCKSFQHDIDKQSEFDKLRSLIAQMMWAVNKEENGFMLQIQALFYQLLHLLTTQYMETSNTKQSLSDKYITRLLRITNYVKENFRQKLSLKELSEREFLSVPYLSKFIKDYLGMTFLEYVDSVRLEHAVTDLQRTDLPIIQIAIENGFPNVKSFNRVFKDVYKLTPGEFRGRMGSPSKDKEVRSQLANYVEVDKESAFNLLFVYLPHNAEEFSEKKRRVKEVYEVSVTSTAIPLEHRWKQLMTVGKAKEILFAPVQQQLIEIQKKINFRYIRFHGIFDDEMMVYTENEQGEPVYNFVYTDMVIDFLISIGVKPFVELGFMPAALASGPDTVFYTKSNVSSPKDINHWKELIRRFIEHCGARYGWTEVKQWYFEVWNEPDYSVFWRGTFEEYCYFYKNSYTAVKDVLNQLRVGGPALTTTYLLNTDWFQRFLSFCENQDCLPDFISFHSYPHNRLPTKGLSSKIHPLEEEQDLNYDTYLIYNENYLQDSIQYIKSLVRNFGLKDLEIHLTEWNSTAVHRDLTNDTSFKAAYIVKNILDNMDELYSFGYWTSTDLIEEFSAEPKLFHGGLGLMTNNGIPKSGFRAFELLNKLGSQLVAKGDGYFITKSSSGYQVMLYHYCHFDKLYSMRFNTNIDLVNRYNVFSNQYIKDKQVKIKGMEPGKYLVKQHILNRQHGSAYDQWVKMGAPSKLSLEDVEYLRSKSIPDRVVQEIILADAEDLVLNAEMTPHEVRLFEIMI